MTATVEIKIDGPQNNNLCFKPLQRTLRGTFDLNRVPEPLARMKYSEFPQPIPGLHIAVDAEKKTATITDPLYNMEHVGIKEKIESMGMKLGPHVETFENIDTVTWLFWCRRAVATGTCKIVAGKFPEIDEAKARKDFIMPDVVADPKDSLINKLVAIMYASMDPEARKRVDALLKG
jgi:hypothetical protein